MTHLCSILCLTIMIALVVPAAGQVPGDFELYQNDPNPFCNDSSGYLTDFQFFCPEDASVTLQVLSPDSTYVVRELMNAVLPAGYHSILWDGKDGGGAQLPAGEYPYVMTAYILRPPLPDFVGTLIATIECGQPVEESTWGAVKSLYQGD